MSTSSSTDFLPSSIPTTPTTSLQYYPQNLCTQNVVQSIIEGRKARKRLWPGGEVVWPPELEAALIEGLENYQPNDSRETQLLGRFPMRNKFVSDWIFKKTGKVRTSKQVGSRLQQIREMHGGRRPLNLLSPGIRRPSRPASPSSDFLQRDGLLPYGPPSLRYRSDSCSDSSENSLNTPIDAHATPQSPLCHRGVETREEKLPSTIIFIDLLSPDSSNGSLASWKSPSQASEERSWVERGYQIVRATQYPRHIRDINPTITLLSHSKTDARSHFTVYVENRLIFSETTTLQPVYPTTSNVDGSLYKTSLVPGLWDTISQDSDPSQYTIIQRVVQDPSTNSTIFSAIYKFALYQIPPTEKHPPTPRALPPPESLAHKSNFSSDSLLSIEPDIYPDTIDFAISPNKSFHSDFAVRPGYLNAECLPALSVLPSPGDYPKSVPRMNALWPAKGSRSYYHQRLPSMEMIYQTSYDM